MSMLSFEMKHTQHETNVSLHTLKKWNPTKRCGLCADSFFFLIFSWWKIMSETSSIDIYWIMSIHNVWIAIAPYLSERFIDRIHQNEHCTIDYNIFLYVLTLTDENLFRNVCLNNIFFSFWIKKTFDMQTFERQRFCVGIFCQLSHHSYDLCYIVSGSITPYFFREYTNITAYMLIIWQSPTKLLHLLEDLEKRQKICRE